MNVYEIITDRILDSLSKGVVPWRKPWHTETPKNLISGKGYRGCNVLLLGSAAYECSYWLTFNQARSLKGSVRKGEKGCPVVFWKIGEERNEQGKTEKTFLLRYYTVFNATQCDGIQVPPTVERPAFNPIAECERIVTGYQGKPRIQHGGDRAYYSPLEDRIQMPDRESFLSSEEYYSCLFHEFGHSSGSHDRLNRKTVTDPISYASHSYSFEELLAETCAAFLCSHGGIASSTIDNSAAYIASWVKALRSDPRMVVMASAQAAKAADLILGKVQSEREEQAVAAE